MARITVEDCLKKIDSQYDLVLLAKERTSQLNAGEKPLVPEDNDKNTVISLREIGEGKISIKTVEDAAINKLRKTQTTQQDLEDLEIEQEDDFDKIYKGEISKSGAAILPSKRVRKIPEKITVTKDEEIDDGIEKTEEESVEKAQAQEAEQTNEEDSASVDNKTE
tara:strand:+ start:633 stop:1127 length:495 start_codon:yes stop_codon:yes gene_type:complete